MFNKKIDNDKMVAKIDSPMYGTNKNFFLLINREVSSYKNKVAMSVAVQDMNPRKLFFKMKNTIVKL